MLNRYITCSQEDPILTPSQEQDLIVLPYRNVYAYIPLSSVRCTPVVGSAGLVLEYHLVKLHKYIRVTRIHGVSGPALLRHGHLHPYQFPFVIPDSGVLSSLEFLGG
jgi:hypothetical protein